MKATHNEEPLEIIKLKKIKKVICNKTVKYAISKVY